MTQRIRRYFKSNYLKNRPEARDKKYLEWRKSVYQRDNYCCVACGKRYRPCVHHLNCWAKFVYERYDVKNGVTLCWTCHTKFHKLYGKKDNTKAQFATFLKIYYKKSLRDIL